MEACLVVHAHVGGEHVRGVIDQDIYPTELLHGLRPDGQEETPSDLERYVLEDFAESPPASSRANALSMEFFCRMTARSEGRMLLRLSWARMSMAWSCLLSEIGEC